MEAYAPEKEERMRSFYHSLNEKDRRRFAGFEALQFGYGGRNYIAGVLGCSRNTVSKGALEVSGLPRKRVEECIREKGKKHTKKRKIVFVKRAGVGNLTMPKWVRNWTKSFWKYYENTRLVIRWMRKFAGQT